MLHLSIFNEAKVRIIPEFSKFLTKYFLYSFNFNGIMKLFYDFMPTYLQEIVTKLADVYQIDSDYALTGLMAVVAGTQGDRYQIIDPKGYRNALASWLIQVGISGYGKSECLSWLMKPLLYLDGERHRQYLAKKREWLNADPKEREEMPIEHKLVMNDYTPEALFDAMEKAGVDGILLYRDELQGWLKDIGRYGKSGEVEQYLSAWSQKAIRITRMLRDDNYIERPCFNVLGGIQPELLNKMLGAEDLIANGFIYRFLFVFADGNFSLNYFKESVPEAMKVAYEGLMRRLLSTVPCEVKFSPAAEESFISYWEDLQRRKMTNNNMIRGLLIKLQIYVEKWAGAIELLANDGTPTQEISGNTMDIAISHMRIFEEWALKAYGYIVPMTFKREPSELRLSKEETLRQLKLNYPNMNKNLVTQGLGINRSALSRNQNMACTPERNIENGVSN